jgi:hypothetical protein
MQNKINKNNRKKRVDVNSAFHGETPPGIREKLAEAARGSFSPGNRSNIAKIKSALR